MKALLGIGLVAMIAFAVFALDVPSRIADLGSGNLNDFVAPTTTVSFGQTVKLQGRAQRPPLAVTATQAVPVRSATKGVRPAEGHVFVGLPLTVENVGGVPFDASMGIETTALDASGAAYRPVQSMHRVRGRHALDFARLPAHRVVRGVVVFEVPRGTTLTSASFTVGSGLTRTATWTTK